MLYSRITVIFTITKKITNSSINDFEYNVLKEHPG
jgi:hypothetical protein